MPPRGSGAPTDDPELQQRVDEIFAGEPEQFVATRDALARELRSAGRADDARVIKALRRPTVSAWALNHVARAHADEVAAYLDASADVRTAQERGSDAGGLRAVIERHRGLHRQLIDAAVDAITERGGNGEAARSELQTTLDAAALDPAVGDAVRAGRLSGAVAPGFAFDVLTVTSTPRASRPAPKPSPAPAPKAARDRTADDKRAQEAAARLTAAERATASAAEHVEDARAEVRRRERELEHARRDAERAERELARARDAEQRARDAVTRSSTSPSK